MRYPYLSAGVPGSGLDCFQEAGCPWNSAEHSELQGLTADLQTDYAAEAVVTLAARNLLYYGNSAGLWEDWVHDHAAVALSKGGWQGAQEAAVALAAGQWSNLDPPYLC